MLVSSIGPNPPGSQGQEGPVDQPVEVALPRCRAEGRRRSGFSGMAAGVGEDGSKSSCIIFLISTKGKPPWVAAPRRSTRVRVVKETPPNNPHPKHEWISTKCLLRKSRLFPSGPARVKNEFTGEGLSERASVSQWRAGIQFIKMQLKHKFAGAHPLYKENPT